MQVNNNQPSFMGEVLITQAAKNAMKYRKMSDKSIETMHENLQKKYKDTDIDITISTISFNGKILDAIVEYKKNFCRYIEEGIFSSIFCRPTKFVKKMNKEIAEKVNELY